MPKGAERKVGAGREREYVCIQILYELNKHSMCVRQRKRDKNREEQNSESQ